MSLTPRMSAGRRLKAFRLADVPLAIRLDAKETLLFGNGSGDRVVPVVNDPYMRTEIGIVADFPSLNVYWISEKAWQQVMDPQPEPEPAEKKPRKRRKEAA